MAVVRPSLVIPWSTNPLSRDDIDKITQYFDEHGLEEFFVQMLLAAGKARPECPYAFMCDYMESKGIRRRGSHIELEGASSRVQSFVKEWQYEPEPQSNRHRNSVNLGFLGVAPRAIPTRSVKAIFDDPCKQVIPEESETQGSQDASASQTTYLSASSSYPLQTILSWEFDVFSQTDEELMRHVYKVMQDGWSFSHNLPLLDNHLKNYITSIHANYRPTNSYHNFKHAFSVMSAVGILLREGGQEYLDLVETFAALISALTHDVGHPGASNDYFVKAKHELAIRYNDIAVLENMHAALTFEIMRMPGNDILADFSANDFGVFRKMAISSILSTDMKVHFDLTSQLQAHLDSEIEPDPTDAAHRILYHNCLVHAGDLSNPVLPTDLCKQWARTVVLEFHMQAEREKREGLPFSPFMEHHPDNQLEFARLQVGFCTFVVKPFWTVLVKFYQNEDTTSRTSQLDKNMEFWCALKNEEERKAEDKKAEEDGKIGGEGEGEEK
eukprot:GEMP01041500.1.p1 GENE.GEMP01041500.1~~GEMP01041500.1.p1  ORF type:complete len:498 (+),score=116.07 GEMP01041500.1:132-1625(+)